MIRLSYLSLLLLCFGMTCSYAQEVHKSEFNTKYQVPTLYGDALWQQDGYFEGILRI